MEKLDKILSNFDSKNVSELKAIFEAELEARQEQIVRLSEMHRQSTIKEYESRLNEQEESWNELKLGLERQVKRKINENRKTAEDRFNRKVDTLIKEAVNKAVRSHSRKMEGLVESSKNNAMTACFNEMLKVAGKSLTGIKKENLEESAGRIKKIERLEADKIALNNQIKILKKQLSESGAKYIHREIKNKVPLSKRDAFDSMTRNIDFISESEYRKDLEKIARTLIQSSAQSAKTNKMFNESAKNEYSKFI